MEPTSEREYDDINKILLFRFKGALTDDLFTHREQSLIRFAALDDLRATILDFSSVTEFPAFSNPIGQQEPAPSILCIFIAPDTIRFGLTRWLKNRIETGTPAVVRTLDEALATLGVQSAHFRKLVRSLRPPDEMLNLNASVTESAGFLRRRPIKQFRHHPRRCYLGEKIELKIVLDPTLAPVEANPSRLLLVILDLAINAREAMPNGGTLIIETANITLPGGKVCEGVSVAPGRYVMLAVSDTGKGMDAETRTHIFEESYTTKPDGTGGSLANVWRFVEEAGGYLHVESESGRGTTFRIYLPRVEALQPM